MFKLQILYSFNAVEQINEKKLLSIMIEHHLTMKITNLNTTIGQPDSKNTSIIYHILAVFKVFKIVG